MVPGARLCAASHMVANMDFTTGAALVGLGVAVGLFGTLIGAGGGFILVPILLLTQPTWSADQVTAVSLAVVFCNALSGTIAYARMKRVDYRSGLAFAAATVPTAILGAYTTNFLPRKVFDSIFGTLLLVACGYLAWRPEPSNKPEGPIPPKHTDRVLIDAEGKEHKYSFDMRIGVGLSGFVGYLSSLLGIGGGIVHVPALVHLLNFPVHIATATSHFILAITALAGTCVHIENGSLSGTWTWVLCLAAGVIVGAQFGAKLSKRLHGAMIVRSLAIALGIVGIRVLVSAIK